MFRVHLRRRISQIAPAVAVIVLASPLPASDLDRTYIYNAADQLIEVKESGITIAEHTYDGDGERVIKRTNGDEIIFVRDPAGQVLAEYDGTTGALIAEYVYLNGQRIARIAADGSTTYYHNDHLGTPRAITDATGQVVWEGETVPFGAEYTATGSRDDDFTFTGHEWDADLDLHYMHARYYSAELGRFISIDPVSGEAPTLQSWNRYSYALNNPLAVTDPDGHAPHVAIGALAGFGLGVGLELYSQIRAGEGINAAKLGTKGGQGMAIGAVAAATGGASYIAAGLAVGGTTLATGVGDRALDADPETGAFMIDEMAADAVEL